MALLTLEGVVKEEGRIEILDGTDLPPNTKVYVIVPEREEIIYPQNFKIHTPKLVKEEDLADFSLEVVAENDEI